LLGFKIPKTDDLAAINLANIQRAAQGGAELTRRLLAFARRQPVQAENTDISELTESLRSMFGHTLGEPIKLKLLLEADPSIACVDPAQLENVLLNLAINARDAMPEGGTFSIRCRNLSLTKEDKQASDENTYKDVNPGDYLRIDVRDTGVGISPEIIDRIFDPFFTTKEVGKGTGLGLSMVFGFARQSNGHVSVASAPGKGTTISLLIPAVL